MEGSHVVFRALIKHDEAGFFGLRKDYPSLVTDLLQDLSYIEGRGDLLSDSFDIFKPFFV
jgi:hypothetical protein